MRKRWLPMMLSLCLFLTLTGCGHEFENYRPIENVNALDGRKVGVNIAWASDYVLSPRDGKDLILYRYDTTADMLMALFYHQIDAMCCDIADWHILEHTNGANLRLVEEPVAMDGYVAYMSPERQTLRDDFNRFLAYYHETDEFADLYQRLMDFNGEHYQPGEYIHPNGSGEKIRLAFCADYFPYCYSETDGTICGYDIEIMYAFADYCNYNIEFIETSYEDMDYGTTLGRYDMGIGTISVSYAPEAALIGIHPTDMYYEMPLYLVELVEGAKLTMSDDFYVVY